MVTNEQKCAYLNHSKLFLYHRDITSHIRAVCFLIITISICEWKEIGLMKHTP